MATFEIRNKKTGEVVEQGRITDWGAFKGHCYKWGGFENDLTFHFRGKEITRLEMLAICDREEEKYFAERRPIRVHKGASNAPNAWSTKWIKK